MLDVRSATEMPRPGDQIAGKYRVEKMIGAGGMGCVLAAEHVLLRTRVAIKLLLPQAAALPGATERFLREAQAAAALRGEHVARVVDVGTTESGAPFLVMEYLVGQDLRKVIRERAPLSVEEAVGYLLQACEAILEAHALGILHRDIKPANLFVTSRPNGTPLVKVLDFGLAKVLAPAQSDAPEETLTQTGQVIGSPHYMPPEQFRSLRNADVRSDIWALGVVLYELLTGKRPFVGEGMAGVMASVIADDPAPASSLRPALPPALDALLMRCLEKPPERRPQWVTELIAALEPFAPKPERASLARIDVAGSVSETVTIPFQRRPADAVSPAVVPASVAAPAVSAQMVTGALPPESTDEPQPLMPPLPGRRTVRMVPAGRSSAADDVTGVLLSDERSAVAAMSAPAPTYTPPSAPVRATAPMQAAESMPAVILAPGLVSDGEQTVATPAADVTDLSQADTTLQLQVGRATADSRWFALAGLLVLLLGGGIGAKVLASDSPDEAAEEQEAAPGTSAAPTAPLSPAAMATLLAGPPPAEAPSAASAVPNAATNDLPGQPAARGGPPAADPPGAKSTTIRPSLEPATSWSAVVPVAPSTSATSSVANPRPSAKVPASAAPVNSSGDNDDPFGKYK
jgi:serine/threonine protein kinase